VTQSDQQARLFACRCVEEVSYLHIDPRSREAVQVAKRFANGEADSNELQQAHKKAIEAAGEIAERHPGSGRFCAAEAARWATTPVATEGAAQAADWAAKAEASDATADPPQGKIIEAFEAAKKKAEEKQANFKEEIYGQK
jgi:hypothetical protein